MRMTPVIRERAFGVLQLGVQEKASAKKYQAPNGGVDVDGFATQLARSVESRS